VAAGRQTLAVLARWQVAVAAVLTWLGAAAVMGLQAAAMARPVQQAVAVAE
jgi:hypothetical protein